MACYEPAVTFGPQATFVISSHPRTQQSICGMCQISHNGRIRIGIKCEEASDISIARPSFQQPPKGESKSGGGEEKSRADGTISNYQHGAKAASSSLWRSTRVLSVISFFARCQSEKANTRCCARVSQ
jgi:hypothetical protein